jgi:peroxiredoxin
VTRTARKAGALAALLAAVPVGCGGEAATVEVVDVAGLQQRLRQTGAPLLVNFWATWCVPCREEMPALLAGTRAFRARGGSVLGVAMECMVADVTPEQGVAKVTEALPALAIDFPVLVCSEGDFVAVRDAVHPGLGPLPQTLVLDASGRVVAHHQGMADETEFEQLAAKALR